MKKIFTCLAIATASLTVAAVPASAQWGQQRGNYGYPGDRGLVNQFHQQLAQIDQRIERSAQRRGISAGEYRALRNHSRELRQRLQRFARDGLSRGEVQDIRDRIDNLRDRIRDERRDGRRGGW